MSASLLDREAQVWSLSLGRRTLTCALECRISDAVLVIHIDDVEIATRTCASASEALSWAAFLLERLSESGWSVLGDPSAQTVN